MRQTGYTSPDQAQQDLQAIRILLMVLLFVALASQLIVSYAAEINIYLAISIMAADLVFFGYVVLYCRNIIKKTEHVSLAQIGFTFMFLLGFAAAPFALVLAPMAYIWFVMPLLEPLEVITGVRKPPESLQQIEQTKTSRKQVNERTWQTILIISLATGFIVAVLSYLELKKII